MLAYAGFAELNLVGCSSAVNTGAAGAATIRSQRSSTCTARYASYHVTVCDIATTDRSTYEIATTFVVCTSGTMAACRKHGLGVITEEQEA